MAVAITEDQADSTFIKNESVCDQSGERKKEETEVTVKYSAYNLVSFKSISTL